MNPLLPALTSLFLLAILPAQDDKPTARPGEKPAPLNAWPKATDAQAEQIVNLMARLKHEKPELRESAAQQLLELGPAAVPMLLGRVNDRADNINPQLFAVFDQLLQPPHAALMARETKRPCIALRRYLTLRLCRFVDPEMQPVLQATLKDKDEDTAYYAALGLLALRQTDALPAVMARSKKDWLANKELIASVLPAARSDEVGRALFESIAKAPVGDQMAGLRLARYLATKEHKVIVRGYLSAEAAPVKKEAINTMRALHDMEPIENLSAFQAVEMAKEWLAKS